VRTGVPVVAILAATFSLFLTVPAVALQFTPVNHDAKALVEFSKRVEGYGELRRKMESGLPKHGKEASPEEIDAHRRALVGRILQARAHAKPGDLFTPDSRAVLQRLLKQVFNKPQIGARTKQAVNDDNPRGIAVAVNQQYPDGAPLTTMPPNVLSNLPKLPEPLQYRFIGRTLILLDGDAELIIDYMPNAMP